MTALRLFYAFPNKLPQTEAGRQIDTLREACISQLRKKTSQDPMSMQIVRLLLQLPHSMLLVRPVKVCRDASINTGGESWRSMQMDLIEKHQGAKWRHPSHLHFAAVSKSIAMSDPRKLPHLHWSTQLLVFVERTSSTMDSLTKISTQSHSLMPQAGESRQSSNAL